MYKQLIRGVLVVPQTQFIDKCRTLLACSETGLLWSRQCRNLWRSHSSSSWTRLTRLVASAVFARQAFMVQTAQKPIEIPQSRFLATRFGEQCLYAQFRGQVTSIPIGPVVSVSLLGDMTGLSVVH